MLERFKAIFAGLETAYGQTKMKDELSEMESMKQNHLLKKNLLQIYFGKDI
jgi:heme oxygenase